MTRFSVPALLIAGLLPLGCTVTTTPADAESPATSADPGGSRPNTGTDPADADPADAEPADADPAATLGPCPAEPRPTDYCTAKGELAGAWAAVDTVRLPDDVEVLFSAEGSDETRQSSLTIAVRGEQLYIRHVTCGGCRRVLGQGFVGALDSLSTEQVLAVQAELGLGEQVEALDSAAKWKAFVADPDRNGVLTKLVNITEMRLGG